MVVKEFVQMRRDRLTFAMMIGIPIMQLILFGYAINMDPKHLPTGILCADESIFSRTLVAAMQNSRYFKVTRVVETEQEGQDLLPRDGCSSWSRSRWISPGAWCAVSALPCSCRPMPRIPRR